MDRVLVILICTIVTMACGSKADPATEEKAIRHLLQQERKAHIDKNVKLFMSEFADSMIFVKNGAVRIPSREENEKRLSSYFGSVQFIKWDDTADPVIRISDDGTMAYAVVQKEVILTYPDTTGKAFYDTTHYAWVSVYRKRNGEWKVETNISTNK